MIVLDTDTVTHLYYDTNEKLRERISEVEEVEDLAITVMTQIEVLHGRLEGILKAANASELKTATQRYQMAEEMLSTFVLLRPDEASCQHFEALTKQRRRKMKRPDMLIASIALANNALLVTRNEKDFKQVAGLRVENWVD
jgi:tRNA(fMet)-specific endonuclease VapC